MPISAATRQAAADAKHQAMLARVATGKKFCPRCGQWKLLAEFAPGAPGRRGDGLAGYCRGCCAAWKRDQRARAAAAKTAAQRYAELAAAWAKPPQPGPADARFWLVCCSGPFVADEVTTWRACHQPGCRSAWQPSIGKGKRDDPDPEAGTCPQ